MITSLIISLLLTLIIELTVSLILGIRKKDDFEIIIAANVCTNPAVVYLANCVRLINNNYIYGISVVILEISAVIIEFIIYKKYLDFKKVLPFKISLINNIISFSLGILISVFKLQ